MNLILQRIREALAISANQHGSLLEGTVVYVGRSEFYDLIRTMHGYTPVQITYADDVRRCTCWGVEVIEVQLPKYLRVA